MTMPNMRMFGMTGGSSGLYPFTAATFTPGAATGRSGPTLVQARAGLTVTGVDTWKTNTLYFDTSSGIQLWTVPRTATYRIEAKGAQGGSVGGYPGGFGAIMRCDVPLIAGEVIRILVGQQGEAGAHTQEASSMGAGGGGTFVVRSPFNTTGSIIVIAGGGGGSTQYSAGPAQGISAVATQNGTAGGGGIAGGSGGLGGSGGGGDGSGPGGAGFTGNGVVDPLSGNVSGENSKSFVNGGVGGRKSLSWGGVEIYGGFGGGGGGGGLACGGGGGYSGGGGGTWSSPQQGGGGGSYITGTNNVTTVGTGTGAGSVTITRL